MKKLTSILALVVCCAAFSAGVTALVSLRPNSQALDTSVAACDPADGPNNGPGE